MESIPPRGIQRNKAVTVLTTRAFFPGAASPCQCRLQISLDRLWVKWIFIRSTDFQQRRFEGEDSNEDSLGIPAPEPLGEGGPDLYYFFLGDEHLL